MHNAIACPGAWAAVLGGYVATAADCHPACAYIGQCVKTPKQCLPCIPRVQSLPCFDCLPPAFRCPRTPGPQSCSSTAAHTAATITGRRRAGGRCCAVAAVLLPCRCRAAALPLLSICSGCLISSSVCHLSIGSKSSFAMFISCTSHLPLRRARTATSAAACRRR